MSAGPTFASGLVTPGKSFTGRRLTKWSSSNRRRSSRPRSSTPLGTPGSPTAPSRIASWSRSSSSTESGNVSPVACHRRAPRSYSVRSILTSYAGVTASSTLRPSATTSGPMPSPAITANRTLRVMGVSVPNPSLPPPLSLLDVGGALTRERLTVGRRDGGRWSDGEWLDLDEVDCPARRGADFGHDRLEHSQRKRRVDSQRDECVTAAGVARNLHAGDVDAVLTQDVTEHADHTGAVFVTEEREVLGQREVDVEVVDLHELLNELRARQRAGNRKLVPVRQGAANGNQIAVVDAVVVGGQAYLDTAVLREQRRVDVGDRLLDDVGEHALENRKFKHLDVVRSDLAADLDLDSTGNSACQCCENAAELLGERQRRPHVFGDCATLHVDRVGHELTRERELHRPRNSGAGLLLRFVGACTKVRRDDDVVEFKQRAGRRRFGSENVEAHAADSAFLQCDRESVFVDESAAGRVDDDDAGLDHGELALTDEVKGFGRLRQVDRDDVGFAQQLFKGDEPDAVLRGACWLHVGVVGNEVRAESGQALRHQLANLAQADDADGLVENLDAGELRALPLP